jgi:hypothetical protein
VSSDAGVCVNLFVRAYGAGDELITVSGPPVDLRAGESQTLSWLPAGIDGGSPIAEVGIHVAASQATGGSEATVYLDSLNWSGAPTVVLTKPQHNGTLWQQAWVKACDDLNFNWSGAIRICQDVGAGLLIQGEREWSNYTVQTTLIPHLARGAGVAACVQGLRRYYALLLCDDQRVRAVMHGPEPERGPLVVASRKGATRDLELGELAVLLPLLALIFVIGLVPGLFTSAMDQSVHALPGVQRTEAPPALFTSRAATPSWRVNSPLEASADATKPAYAGSPQDGQRPSQAAQVQQHDYVLTFYRGV